MSTATMAPKKPKTDGRKLRTNDSRKKIVDAFLKLIVDGNVAPSGEEVATAANVSLSTVFRRFPEMELLYREVAVAVQTQYVPKFLIPFESEDWRGQLAEMVERRAGAFEVIMPYRIAGKVLMHRSQFLADNQERWALMQRSQLELVLPFSDTQQPKMFAAIESTMSFDHWIQLRKAQNLTPQQTQAQISYMLGLVLNTYEG